MAPFARRDPQFLTPVPTAYAADFQPLKLAQPASVVEFQVTWDSLGQLTLSYATKQDAFWVQIGEQNGGTGGALYHRDDPAEEAWPLVDLSLEPLSNSYAAWWRDRTEHEFQPRFHLVGHTPWGGVSVPVEVGQATLSLRAALARRHERLWSTGSFANNFPELSVATRDHVGLGFEETRAQLESESADLAEDIVIFGLAIPADVVSRWGGAVVILAQFYYWLHLRGFLRIVRGTAAATLAPWIGVYDDPLARIATAVTSFMVPPVVLGFLVSGEILAAPALAVVVAISAVLGVVSWRTLRDGWAAIV